MKMLLKDNNVDMILRRLGRLTSDEARASAVQTLEVVLGLVQNMKLVMDGEKGISSLATRSHLNIHPTL
jgi:hypothetical protein